VQQQQQQERRQEQFQPRGITRSSGGDVQCSPSI
jgi:hypothetical protein